MSLDFFPCCSPWDLLSLLLVFTLSLLSLLLLWLLFYTHNKHNYPNNYQTINYSFKCYFLFFFFTITVVVIIIIINNNTNIIIIITFIIISIIIIVYFVFSPFCKCILYPLIFLFFMFMPQVQDEQSHPLHLIWPISFLWLPFLD